MAEEKKRDEEEFSFVKEKIKRQHFYQNRTFRKVVFQLVLAAACGITACFVFVVSYPWMEERFRKEERQEISLPREEEDEPVTAPQEPAPPQEPLIIT